MARAEVYPWSTLVKVGDYFTVSHEYKPYPHMAAIVSVRNSYQKDKFKYSCTKTSYGCIVMLAQVQDYMPEYDVQIVEGVRASAKHTGELDRPSLGNRPETRELSVQERVNRMSPEQREANLPWWYDPINKKLIWNGKIATHGDTAKYLDEGWRPAQNNDYPEYYHLDSNLIKREVVEEDEEEDFGDHPIFGDGSGNLGEVET